MGKIVRRLQKKSGPFQSDLAVFILHMGASYIPVKFVSASIVDCEVGCRNTLHFRERPA